MCGGVRRRVAACGGGITYLSYLSDTHACLPPCPQLCLFVRRLNASAVPPECTGGLPYPDDYARGPRPARNVSFALAPVLPGLLTQLGLAINSPVWTGINVTGGTWVRAWVCAGDGWVPYARAQRSSGGGVHSPTYRSGIITKGTSLSRILPYCDVTSMLCAWCWSVCHEADSCFTLVALPAACTQPVGRCSRGATSTSLWRPETHGLRATALKGTTA